MAAWALLLSKWCITTVSQSVLLFSPYREARDRLRNLFPEGNFIEICVSTPLEVCQERDPKGHYVKSNQGKMKGFTGVDDTYEPPVDPDITIDTSNSAIDESVEAVLAELRSRGFIA